MLEGETHVGLATVISARCTNCHHEFKINSSTASTTHFATGAKKWHINIAAVLGQMSTGGGNARLEKDHPEYRGRGGLTKRAIQRLTVGARIAIRLHSWVINKRQEMEPSSA